ncbi:MAG: hypothetical protein COA44_11590 [Arcobacter sp.]|nr:MAG: hypothetical protein COA44_11590 [Arcobacter sp.]
MELKDVILSTLEELEHTKEDSISPAQEKSSVPETSNESSGAASLSPSHNEELYLKNMRERIHVLFEGFQSPNNANIEAKVDLTLNFLEYLLSTIETRLKEIK